jgi:hypothetical protein
VLAAVLLGALASAGCPTAPGPDEAEPPPPPSSPHSRPEAPATEKSGIPPPLRPWVTDDQTGGAGSRHRPRPVAGPDFDSIEKTFRMAQASYVIPATMTAGESAHVHLDLSFQRSLDELRAELQKHLPGAEVVTTTLRTSSVAQARLTGQHFQITAVTPEEQPVGASTTTWEWEVTPDSGGRRPLHLSVDAVFSIGADTRRWTINTFERDVLVRVSVARRVTDFVGGNWQWLWTAIVVPAGGWILIKRRAKRGAAPRRRRAPS